LCVNDRTQNELLMCNVNYEEHLKVASLAACSGLHE